MISRFTGLVLVFILTACGTPKTPAPAIAPPPSQTPTPTHTPQPLPTATSPFTTPTPTPSFSTIAGQVCYPSSQPPPMKLYLQNTANAETTTLDIERGQITYTTILSPGRYIAYAHTVGMHLRGAYTCNSNQPCPFQIKPGQTQNINLCDWYSPPGIWPPAANQADKQIRVKLLQNMHARTGPHLSYPELGLLEAGTVVEALERNPDSEWLQVKHPDLNATGWLHAPLTQVMGDPFILPVNAQLPPAQPRPHQFVPAIWRSDYNQEIVHFKGSIRDASGRPVNGYSIFLDNGTWSVISHPTGASRHYPDVGDGLWDVVIPNETDAAGWWTMTVVRYECPDFEIGFNGQCKQFTPLSETKVVKVVHPDENVIEANWTCLENCNQGLYLKPYRRPVEPLDGNLLLYVEDRALKASPASPVFDHVEIKRIYDNLPDTPNGLQAYLANHRPKLSPDGRYLIINAPAGVTWLAELATGHLREISPASVPAAWRPDSSQIAYIKHDTLYIFDVATGKAKAIWQYPDLVNPMVNWFNGITVQTDESAWRITPDGQQVEEIEPQAETATQRIETILTNYLAGQGFSSATAWALSHNQRRVAFSVSLSSPLENAIAILNLETQNHTLVGPINGYRVPEIRWTANDELLIIGATNPKFPSGGALFTMEPEPNVLPEILLESDTAYLVDVFPQK